MIMRTIHSSDVHFTKNSKVDYTILILKFCFMWQHDLYKHKLYQNKTWKSAAVKICSTILPWNYILSINYIQIGFIYSGK